MQNLVCVYTHTQDEIYVKVIHEVREVEVIQPVLQENQVYFEIFFCDRTIYLFCSLFLKQ